MAVMPGESGCFKKEPKPPAWGAGDGGANIGSGVAGAEKSVLGEGDASPAGAGLSELGVAGVRDNNGKMGVGCEEGGAAEKPVEVGVLCTLGVGEENKKLELGPFEVLKSEERVEENKPVGGAGDGFDEGADPNKFGVGAEDAKEKEGG
jgi:hypothetical protein